MIREDRFVISHKPYAVDLGSLRVTEIGEGYTTATVNAIWFRRRRGETVAVYGHLWDHQNPPLSSAVDFLTRHDDGRYGGRALARWDGSTLWAPETPFEVAQERQEMLRVALDAYPAAPSGYDGWWTFHKAEVTA
jgi:hypothetical protein